MKPYTLEWWIDLMYQSDEKKTEARKISYNCRAAENTSLADSWWERYCRHEDLSKWIYNRIINKYGE